MSGAIPAIAATGLWKVYDEVEALRGLELQLAEGASLTIFGPNAAGKTTLLKVLATLVRPSAGSVLIGGRDLLREAGAVRRLVGLLSHQPYLYPQLSAAENLVFYARLFGLAQPRRRAAEALEWVGLARRADERVAGFSRGMQQKVSLARLLLHDPRILLLDEPFTGLDQEGAQMLRAVLASAKAQGKTIVMTTHHLDEGLDCCAEVAVQVDGRLVFRTPVDQVDRARFPEVYEETVRAARRSAPRPARSLPSRRSHPGSVLR